MTWIKASAAPSSLAAGHFSGINHILRPHRDPSHRSARRVYDFLRLEMRRYGIPTRSDSTTLNPSDPHYFVILKQGGTWCGRFESMLKQPPLGPFFLGSMTGLDSLFKFLDENVRPQIGRKAVIHVLMAIAHPLVFPDPVAFPEEAGNLLIHGQLSDHGTPYVWMFLPRQVDQDRLDGIGVLNSPNRSDVDTMKANSVIQSLLWPSSSNALHLMWWDGLLDLRMLGTRDHIHLEHNAS